MKMILTIFKAPFSLGLLGLVILLMLAALVVSAISQVSAPFDGALERMSVLDTLENDITFDLGSMQIQEAYKTFALLYETEEDEDSAQKAQQADARIGAALADLEEAGAFSAETDYGVDLSGEVRAFNELRAAHRQTFAEMVSAYQAGGEDQAAPLLDQLEEENAALKAALRELIIQVEQGRLAALGEFPADANTGTLFATLGLTLCLILALLGYQIIAATVRPLHSLRNTITAIGGDQYRPEMQGNLLKKSGPSGSLARSLDQLARSMQQRNAGLKAETERLRSELYESRRRRLKITHPTGQGGERG